jgi:DNA polymerase
MTPFSPHDLIRMTRQHVDAFRAAGIEWIPRLEPLPPAASSSEEPVAKQKDRRGREEALADRSLYETAAAPMLKLTRLEKEAALKELNEGHVIGCVKCPLLAQSRTQTVFGVGNVDCELCFVGEAPGADEDRQGEPFVGAAGQLLNKIIVACQMQREDVYICNCLKCRPPGNRQPQADELAHCFPYLERQLDIIRPKFLCALGSVAAQTLLKTTVSIGKLRGKFHDYKGIPLLCTYHPAYLLRNPAAKKDVWEDMKMLMARMGRPVG